MTKLSQQSKRFLDIIHQYHLYRGPQCISVASSQGYAQPGEDMNHLTPLEMYNQAISQSQSPPQLLLSFSTSSTLREDPYHMVVRRCPSNMVTLTAVADTIQTAGIFGNGAPECKSRHSLTMLSGLPSNTLVRPFLLSNQEYTIREIPTFVDEHFDAKLNWKLVVLYVVGDRTEMHENFILKMQSKFPGMIVVGGCCSAAFVSVPIRKRTHFPSVEYMVQTYSSDYLRLVNSEIGGQHIPDTDLTHEQLAAHVYNEIQHKKFRMKILSSDNGGLGGICGVALAGDVPVRCVVSRGVESFSALEQFGDGAPALTSNYCVNESTYRYTEIGEYQEHLHEIDSVRNISTGKILRYVDIITRIGYPDFIGIRHTEDGFFLDELFHGVPHLSVYTKAFTKCRDLVGAGVDFFKISGEQSMKDMEFCMKELLQEVLGALMFTCNERGPDPGSFISEAMFDAKCWARHFPNVACTGFFANREIGPSPLAGRQSIIDSDNIADNLLMSSVVLLFLALSVHLDKPMEDAEEGMLNSK